MLRRKIFFFSIVGFLALVYAMGHTHVSERRAELGVQYRMSVAPVSPEIAEILAGEFSGIAADYLLLEIGALIGSNKKISTEEWKQIALAFEQAMELDPYFQQTYLMVQGHLPWKAEMPEKAIELLGISHAHRTWDWRPGFYMGFNYYYFLNDFENASDVLLEAAKVKDAPVLLAVLGGRFALRGKRTETATMLLESMLEDPNLEEKKRKEIEERVAALKGAMTIQRAVEIFERRFGAAPESLEALVREGILAELPENPYGVAWVYEPDRRSVYFDEIK